MHIKGGIFSFTAPAPAQDTSYLHWHLMDHMPEQYRIPGIVLGQRWIADGEYIAARVVSGAGLGDIGNVVNYLFRDPVTQTLDDFTELGANLSAAGRYPIARPALQISAMRLLHCVASPRALVAPEVIPFRPHRGVLLIVEQPGDNESDWLDWIRSDHLPALMETDGVAGAWMFGSTDHWSPSSPIWSGRRQFVTTVYLDRDPLSTTAHVANLVETRWATGAVQPEFVGPLRAMVNWDAWP